jgi:hypothetical protein
MPPKLALPQADAAHPCHELSDQGLRTARELKPIPTQTLAFEPLLPLSGSLAGVYSLPNPASGAAALTRACCRQRVEYFYWEILELVRRTILIGWVLMLPDDRVFLRLVVATLLSVGSLTLLLSTRPYKRGEDSLLSAGCQLALVFSFIGASYIRLFVEFSRYLPYSVVRRVMAFESTTQLAALLISLTLVMAAVMLVMMIQLIRKEGSRQTIRLVTTNMPPQLTVEKNQKWALFLSHIVRHPPSLKRINPSYHIMQNRAMQATTNRRPMWRLPPIHHSGPRCPALISGRQDKTPTRRSSGSFNASFLESQFS